MSIRDLLPFLHPAQKEKATNNEIQLQRQATLPTDSTVIVVLYHHSDRELMYDLSPHINGLALRLNGLFEWKYYLYPLNPVKPEENLYEQLIQSLREACLFLPFTSASFCSRFLQECQKDERIPELLSKVYVQPIPLRAVHGVSTSILPQPLAAYSQGHQREEACVRIVEQLEQKLLAYRRSNNFPQQEPPKVPPLVLAETAKSLVVK